MNRDLTLLVRNVFDLSFVSLLVHGNLTIVAGGRVAVTCASIAAEGDIHIDSPGASALEIRCGTGTSRVTSLVGATGSSGSISI